MSNSKALENKRDNPNQKKKLSFKERFAGLKTLVAMQLKDKLNFSFKADKKGALIKISLFLILIIVLTAALAILMNVFGQLSVFGMGWYVPISVFNLFFFAIFIFQTLSCIVRLTNSLYFSKDNMVLLSYPVRPGVTFLSKLIVFYILEIVKSFAFMVPLFIAYGIMNGFAFYFYPWLIFTFLFVCMLPVVIASILSIPYMAIKMQLRKNPLIQDLLMVVILIGATAGIFILINMIPADLHFITKWADTYWPAFHNFCLNLEVWLAPLFYLSSLMIGCVYGNDNPRSLTVFTSNTPVIFACVIGIILFCIILSYLLAKPLFLKIAVKPFEYNKKAIKHNFSILRSSLRNKVSYAYVPRVTCKTKADKKELFSQLQDALKHIKAEGQPKVDYSNDKAIIRLIKKYTNFEFDVVDISEVIDKQLIAFFVDERHGVKELSIIRKYGVSYISCYDTNYLGKQNHEKTAFMSSIWKDILTDTRTAGVLAGNYCLLVASPIAISLLNKIFDSINTSYLGDGLCVTFSMLILTLIPLASNVIMASVYSREGESMYLLKVSPANYIKTLTTKLIMRWFLVSLSIGAAVLCYSFYSHVSFLKPAFIFFAVEFLYTGHLLWSAELDFMNPMDRLYSEIGEGSIGNPNETVSAIIAALIAIIFTAITYFFIKESTLYVFYKLFLIALLFLIARILLFVLKIKGYRTSRGERGRD